MFGLEYNYQKVCGIFEEYDTVHVRPHIELVILQVPKASILLLE